MFQLLFSNRSFTTPLQQIPTITIVYFHNSFYFIQKKLNPDIFDITLFNTL